MPSEAEVEAAAKVLANSPGIDAPKLNWPCWMGTARSVLAAAEEARSGIRQKEVLGGMDW